VNVKTTALEEIREFQEARRVSCDSQIRVRVGALVIKGNKKLGCACNRDGITTFRAEGIHALRFPRHAEIQAILQAGIENVRGATVWVWRETSKGIPALSRPCEKCMAFMQIAEIKRIVYTTSTHPHFNEEAL